ncbi:hypothetical protein QTG54_016723 [Skeletonema marinoi]|uniref:Uncharacterized protein n=1 Tax=Skeletonema marinoi TaxID=267567 RepID=A0AAD9D3R4_9STRA|nr:hypothetical protein QTG54_016723 [Skeletonema marinoi]
MATIELTAEHGKCIAILILLWLQQQLVFAIAVAFARKKSGIDAPTLYPRDSEIKKLNLSEKDVDSYMCTFYAGIVVLMGRMVTALGYYRGASKRVAGGWFHFGEYYVVYLAGKFAYKLINEA